MRLECNNLNFTYPDSKVAVINNLSFLMEKPGFKALFGPSGAGKTSLAKMIANPGFRADGRIITENIDTKVGSIFISTCIESNLRVS